MEETLQIPLPRWPKSQRGFDTEEAHQDEKLTQRTPEEEFKISRFHQWLETTAQEQCLSDEQKAARSALYEAVSALRPYTPLQRRQVVQAQTEMWANEHPADPLADILRDYLQSALEEVLLWREAFPELEQEEAPTLFDKSKNSFVEVTD